MEHNGLRKGKIQQCHIDRSDPETFVVGKVLEIFDDCFLLQTLSVYGEWDGFALYPLRDLVSVEEDRAYLEKMRTLLREKGQPEPEPPTWLSGNGWEQILCYARRHHRLVAMELYGSGLRDVTGHPGDYGAVLRVDQVDEFGKPDGVSFLNIGAITRIYLGDAGLHCLELLDEGV